jgi:hypothetical protein
VVLERERVAEFRGHSLQNFDAFGDDIHADAVAGIVTMVACIKISLCLVFD